nr:biotin synthase BioB [Buchnera aphidicola]
MKKQWNIKQVDTLFKTSFIELMFHAQIVHRKNFNPNIIQISTLLSIKTGSCPEDCKYCPQSARYKTDIKKEHLLNITKILKAAYDAKKSGSTRFCIGAAWKNPADKDIPYLENIIKKVKKIGMETCMTLGSLTKYQAKKLSQAGLDFYNHNLDTSPKYYHKVITTRSYQERLDTLKNVRDSGMKICSGGIIGLGEKTEDRKELLLQLANLPQPPESVPINMLVQIKGTPLEKIEKIDSFEFIRIVAIARIMMPQSYIRLSAGRNQMNEEMQAMCFMAGANSIFYGCKLLTTSNPKKIEDFKLFKKLGLTFENNLLLNNKHTFQRQLFSKTINEVNNKYYNADI